MSTPFLVPFLLYLTEILQYYRIYYCYNKILTVHGVSPLSHFLNGVNIFYVLDDMSERKVDQI